jgi:hypothetical protein
MNDVDSGGIALLDEACMFYPYGPSAVRNW